MGQRLEAFPDSFMETNFGSAHKFLFGNENTPTPKFGYPDTGAGLFARELPYKDWFKLNIFQRIRFLIGSGNGLPKRFADWIRGD